MSLLTFKELIDEALMINNLSINKLATLIGVDRPYLQHALVGRRPLRYDTFEKIMSFLSVPEHLNCSLRETFAKEYFGESNFNTITHILEILNTMSKNESMICNNDILNDSSILLHLCNTYNLNSKQTKLINIIYTELTEELKKSTPTIYTTYSFKNECLRTLFLYILSSKDSFIDYKHLIYKEPSWSELDIIDNYFYQYEFAGFGYNTYISHNKQGLSSSPLPYFILTSKSVIFFSDDFSIFIRNDSKDIRAYISNFFINDLDTSIPFSNFMNTKESFTLFTSLTSHNLDNQLPYMYDLSSNICLATYIDTNILSDCVPDSFEHKDFFVHGVSSFFNFYTQAPHSAIWHLDSLMNFTENDENICDYHNVTFDMLHLAPKHKYKLLCQLYEYALSDTIHHFVMNNSQQFPSYFHINCFFNSIVLGFNFKVYDTDAKQRLVTTSISQDPIIYKHLRNLCEYYEHSTFVYSTSTNYALNLIENTIKYYKKKHNL